MCYFTHRAKEHVAIAEGRKCKNWLIGPDSWSSILRLMFCLALNNHYGFLYLIKYNKEIPIKPMFRSNRGFPPERWRHFTCSHVITVIIREKCWLWSNKTKFLNCWKRYQLNIIYYWINLISSRINRIPSKIN